MRRYCLAVAIAMVAMACAQERKPATESVTPAEVAQMMAKDSSVVLLDVRTEAEFESETGHLKAANLIPVQELEERIGELDAYKDKTIVAYCRSGQRSAVAAKILQSRGFRVFNMTGGMLRWNDEHRPVQREAKE